MAELAVTKESCGWSDLHIYDWTMSLCGLVVRVLAQNVRGVRFDPHQGLYTFQSYHVVKIFKRVNVKLFSITINILRTTKKIFRPHVDCCCTV